MQALIRKGESMYKKFEELLSKHNTTTYKVSKETGISQTTFTDWKNGKYTPKIDKLQKIAEYFGVEVSYFIN
jgi:transcriptional regulator with XRE-family HTH domain